MASQLVPLDANPNQTWQVTLSVDGKALTLGVQLNYNEVAALWEMSIYDSNGNLLVSSLPLVTGVNLLKQLGYLNIGSLYVVNVGGVDPPDYPNDANLGSSFVAVWGDTEPYGA